MEPQMRAVMHYWLRWQVQRVVLLVAVAAFAGALGYVAGPMIGAEALETAAMFGALVVMAAVVIDAIRRAWRWWRGPT